MSVKSSSLVHVAADEQRRGEQAPEADVRVLFVRREPRRMRVAPADVADDEHVGIVPVAGLGERRGLVLLVKPMLLMLSQVSVMSPVVRQQLPSTEPPHFQTSDMPYWQRLKTMSRFCSRRNLPIRRYG